MADTPVVACAQEKGLTGTVPLDTAGFSTYGVKHRHRQVPFKTIPSAREVDLSPIFPYLFLRAPEAIA